MNIVTIFYKSLSGMLMMLLLGLTGCDQPSDTHSTEADQHMSMRYAIAEPVASLDPLFATPPSARLITGTLFDTLYRYRYLARPYQLQPGLAVDFPDISADGLVYTIRLRQGVQFQQDPALPEAQRELTADDVVYSLLRHFDPDNDSQAVALWQGLIAGMPDWQQTADFDDPPAGLQSIDRYTLTITLTAPSSDFLHTLALPVSAVVKRVVVEHYGRDIALHPVGTGPYQLQRFTTGNITLAANPDYRQAPLDLPQLGFQPQHAQFGLKQLAQRALPLLDQIEIRFIPDADRRLQQLQSGAIDAMQLRPSQFPIVLQTESTVLLQAEFQSDFMALRQPTARLYKLDFNMRDEAVGSHADPALDQQHRELRCQLAAAYNWQTFNQEFFDGLGFYYPGVLTPVAQQPETTSQPAPKPQQSITVDELPVLNYGFADSRLNQRYFEHFRDSLAAAGYPEALIKPLRYDDFNGFSEAFNQGDLPLVFAAWQLDIPSHLNTLQLYSSAAAPPGPGVAQYQNPRFDALLDAAIGYNQPHLQHRQRAELVNSMQQILQDDCVSIAGFSPAQVHIWRNTYTLYPDAEFASSEFLRYAMPAAQPR